MSQVTSSLLPMTGSLVCYDERTTIGNIAGASQNSTSDIYVQDSQWSGGGASRID